MLHQDEHTEHLILAALAASQSKENISEVLSELDQYKDGLQQGQGKNINNIVLYFSRKTRWSATQYNGKNFYKTQSDETFMRLMLLDFCLIELIRYCETEQNIDQIKEYYEAIIRLNNDRRIFANTLNFTSYIINNMMTFETEWSETIKRSYENNQELTSKLESRKKIIDKINNLLKSNYSLPLYDKIIHLERFSHAIMQWDAHNNLKGQVYYELGVANLYCLNYNQALYYLKKAKSLGENRADNHLVLINVSLRAKECNKNITNLDDIFISCLRNIIKMNETDILDIPLYAELFYLLTQSTSKTVMTNSTSATTTSADRWIALNNAKKSLKALQEKETTILKKIHQKNMAKLKTIIDEGPAQTKLAYAKLLIETAKTLKEFQDIRNYLEKASQQHCLLDPELYQNVINEINNRDKKKVKNNQSHLQDKNNHHNTTQIEIHAEKFLKIIKEAKEWEQYDTLPGFVINVWPKICNDPHKQAIFFTFAIERYPDTAKTATHLIQFTLSDLMNNYQKHDTGKILTLLTCIESFIQNGINKMDIKSSSDTNDLIIILYRLASLSIYNEKIAKTLLNDEKNQSAILHALIDKLAQCPNLTPSNIRSILASISFLSDAKKGFRNEINEASLFPILKVLEKCEDTDTDAAYLEYGIWSINQFIQADPRNVNGNLQKLATTLSAKPDALPRLAKPFSLWQQPTIQSHSPTHRPTDAKSFRSN